MRARQSTGPAAPALPRPFILAMVCDQQYFRADRPPDLKRRQRPASPPAERSAIGIRESDNAAWQESRVR